jgi:hypothetical protein
VKPKFTVFTNSTIPIFIELEPEPMPVSETRRTLDVCFMNGSRLSYLILSYLILSYLILSYLILFSLFLSYLLVKCKCIHGCIMNTTAEPLKCICYTKFPQTSYLGAKAPMGPKGSHFRMHSNAWNAFIHIIHQGAPYFRMHSNAWKCICICIFIHLT